MFGPHYPAPAPALRGEDNNSYTNRLVGLAGPYDHRRYRQCALGFHTECSQRHATAPPCACDCPCHADIFAHHAGEADQSWVETSRWSHHTLADLYYLPHATSGRVVTVVRDAVANGADTVDKLRTALTAAYGCAPSDSFLVDVVAIMNQGALEGRDADVAFAVTPNWAAIAAEAATLRKTL